MKCERTMEAGS